MTSLLEHPPIAEPRTTGLVVALGDSITSGEGVGIITPANSTWAALLADALGARAFHNFARAGARLAHVRAEQLPRAVALRPELATLCVGLNDIVKTGCPPTGIAENITALIGGLRAVGSTVVVTRLHDPSAIFRLPRGLAAQVVSRVELLNATIDAVAFGDPGVIVIDVGDIQSDRACWAVDRVHPSVWGQRRLAAIAAAQLDLPSPAADPDEPAPCAPSTAAHLRWLVRAGVPWLAKRFPEVGPPVGRMALAAAGAPVARLARLS